MDVRDVVALEVVVDVDLPVAGDLPLLAHHVAHLLAAEGRDARGHVLEHLEQIVALAGGVGGGQWGEHARLQRALRDFYESQARADVAHWLPGYLGGLPRPPQRMAFKRMTSQWGSLSPAGNVVLDLSLVLARPSAFQYVLVHELCHLIHGNHSRSFWREVEARFPRWREERDYFRAEGRRLKATLRSLLG